MSFPVFFFFLYMLWQCFLLLLLQLSVCKEVTAIALNYGHLGYIERAVGGESAEKLSWAYLPLVQVAMPKEERAEHLNVLCVSNEEGKVFVTVTYDFVCEAVLLPRVILPVRQSFCFYPYLGEYDRDLLEEETAEHKDVVYVTETGTVYHESRACTYLKLSIRSVDAENLKTERNSSGKKYTACERCRNGDVSGVYYVTSYGDKYHCSLTCSGLKRTVIEKDRSEIGDMRACSKCGQKNKE